MNNWGSGPMPWGGQEWAFTQWPLLGLVFAPLVLLVVLWALFWKGLALWHASRRGQYWWFGVLLVVNTVGILEIIYLFFVAKLKFSELFSFSEHHHTH